jgi:tetratricopeptide (TPR) repeat protein
VNLFQWSAAAASLALCAALVIWQVNRQAALPEQPPQSVAVRHAEPAPPVPLTPAAPPAQVPQPVAARQAEPAPLPPAPRAPVTQQPDALKLEKPAVKLTLAMLTWRGSDGAQRGIAQDIAPALDLYRADRFAEAAARLEALAQKYKDSVEVFFYLGACRLLLGQFPEASAAFERAAVLADDTFSADVSWYLGLSYQRSGRQPEARARFSALCGTQNVHRDRACAALKELGR